MRRSSSPMDKKLMCAQAQNRVEDKLLNRKITSFSRTEQQLQRELQQIQRARLSFQQGLENLNIPNINKGSFDSNKYTRQMHSKRRFSTGNILEVPKRDTTKLAGAVKLPDILPRESSVLKNNTSKLELIKVGDRVACSDAGGKHKKPHSPFPRERHSLTPLDTEVDTDGIDAEDTQQSSASFFVPSYRRLRNRRQSLPVLSPICCEEFEEESNKGEKEMENERENGIESGIEEEGMTRTSKVVPSIRLDLVEIHGDIRPVSCAVSSEESKLGQCRSKDFVNQDEKISHGACAVPRKESSPSQRLLSKDLIDIDQKQRLYARRGRRASAPTIMTYPQTPQAFTQSQSPSIPMRKTNQDLISDECLKGKFRAIGHGVLGSVLLKSRRKSITGVSENELQKELKDKQRC